jgi:phospholipid-translocating P-type ATPase (flippase)
MNNINDKGQINEESNKSKGKNQNKENFFLKNEDFNKEKSDIQLINDYNNNNLYKINKENQINNKMDNKISPTKTVKGKGKKLKSNMRKIFINNSTKNLRKYNYINNFVKSSIYTAFDFLPKSLLFQFRRYANIYFLIVTSLQFVPAISPLNPITAIVPFLFVLGVSMIREAIEDFKRHQSDNLENSLKVQILDNEFEHKTSFNERELFKSIKSSDLQVGNIVKISKNTVIPADMIILSCSNPSKTAYIETSNLDGEKNLKPILCLLRTFNLIKNVENDKEFKLRGKIRCIPPTTELSTFNAEIFLDGQKHGLKVDKKNFLYKGTTLKDTDWAIGCVVYTGRETKIIMNINKSSGKVSHLEKLINKLMILIFLIQLLLSIIAAAASSFFYYYTFNKNLQTYIIFEDNFNSIYSGIFSFFSYLLLLNTMIPISLIVTLELVKYGQAIFMKWDIEMYSKLRSTFVEVNSSSLNEEMGQIKYIFSDKTGTLTTNKLVFKKAFIWDTEFGKLSEELLEENKNNLISSEFPFNEVKNYSVYGKSGNEINIELFSGNKENNLLLNNSRDMINQFMYCISLNQNCFINKSFKLKEQLPQGLKRTTTGFQKKLDDDMIMKYKENTAGNIPDMDNIGNYDINYTGESPDEIILTNSIKQMGCVYFEGDDRKKILGILKGNNGSEIYVKEEFEILKVMEFNSERGMSSIIVKKNGKIFLYSKGGDGKINLRLSKENNQNKQKIFDKVKFCSEKGYRVLCSAMKILDDEEYLNWFNELEDGLQKIDDEKEKESFANKKYFEIEKGLILLGCTVVEDKLQENVPETIKELQSAGINIWVLTGDNLETARNIGIMCNLLPDKMEKFYLYGELPKMKKNMEQEFQIFIDNTDEKSINDAKEIIERFENDHRKFYEIPPNNKDLNVKDEIYEAYLTSQKLKQMLFIFLQRLKSKMEMDKSDSSKAGILKGMVIEMVCLNAILPPQIKNFPAVLYLHPLTQLFLDVALQTQAVVCCR